MTTDRKGAGASREAALLSARQRALFGLAVVATIALSAPVFSQATAFDYAPGRVTIKAAVVTIDPGAPNPNLTVGAGVMEGLRRASFRPSRWDIVNPRGGTGLGGYVAEWSAAYWEVVVPPGQHTDLSGYHLLYLCAADLTALDDFQIDSIMQAVNEGAVLWIDSAKPTNTGAAGTGTPWQDCPFFCALAANTLAVGGTDVPSYALLTQPFRIGVDQLPLLGVAAGWDTIDPTPNVANMRPLLRDSPGGSVLAAVGRYGSGGFVVTGGNVGAEIASWTGAAVPDPAPGQAVDVMFGYNVIAWATGWTQSRQAARGAGASLGEVRGDLDVKWQSLDVGDVTAPPVIDDAGRMFLVSYAPQPRLYCFDSDPEQDLDGDGMADDGVVRDYTGEGSADLIWSYDYGPQYTPRSAGAAVATALIGGQPTEVVVISMVSRQGTRAQLECLDAVAGGSYWTADLPRFAGQGGRVRSCSTPVIHNGYVYVLSSEHAQAGPGANPEDNTYGRVHCVPLSTGTGFTWSYPDETKAPGGAAADQYRMALPPVDDPVWVADPTTELPPVPTPTPSVCDAARLRATEVATGPTPSLDPHLDAVVCFGAPASKAWDATNVRPITVPSGSDFALLPVPADAAGAPPSPDPFQRNRQYCRLMLDVASPTAVNATTYVCETPAGAETVPYAGLAPTISSSYAQYRPDQVETFLASIPASSPSTTYYDVQTGCRVLVNYAAGGTQQELDFLPGPVLYCRPHEPDRDPALTPPEQAISGERAGGGQAISGDVLSAALTVAFDGLALNPASPLSRRAGAVVGLKPATGDLLWKYDPHAGAMGNPNAATVTPPGAGRVYVNSAPADAGSAVVGACSYGDRALVGDDGSALGQVFALDPRPDITLRLRVPIPAGHSNPPSVQLAAHTPPQVWLVDGSVAADWDANPNSLPQIDPACYRVDYPNRRIIFPAESAHNVQDINGVALGPVYGRMLIVNYTYDANDPVTPDDPTDDNTITGEVYAAPDLARWQYIPGMFRLRHHPVAWANGPVPVTMLLANGEPVTGFSPGENLVKVGTIDWLPTGLINMDTATFGLTPARVLRGAEVLVSYAGFSPDGPVRIPNAYEPLERQQVPYSFGRPVAGVTAANDGQTLVVGTESHHFGYSNPANAAWPGAGQDVGGYAVGSLGASPAFEPDATRTLLVLGWDKVSDLVRGRLVRPICPPPAAQGVPVVSASPAVDGDTLFVGSRMLTAVPDPNASPPQGYEGTPAGAPPYGYASALSPMRTVITDNERIVETVGAEPDWECLGTRTLDSSWANATAAADPGYPLNVPTTRTPFSRPAKAVRLTREDFLATYVTGAGAVEPYKLPIYPPEPGISPPAGIPAGTAWPPSPSGVGPGNYLVVDTGNDRVVEVDRKGRQVWPLANYAVPPTIPSGSRRLGDGLGFDFYTSPLNDVLDLQAPTDAQRYMLWNAATATWEMHTVIADSGHYRVIDVLTTFDYDVTTGSVLQTHEVQTVTPPLVRATTGPRRGEFIRVAYTRAQPLWDPGNGQLIGYLCAANNLHELLVIEAGTQRVNPPGADPLPSGSGGTWAMWSWLYDQDQDATTDDRLIFENLRHMEVRYERDEYGDPYLFLAVVCGRYQGPRSDPVTGTGRPFENVGAVCLEFRVGDPVLDDTDPATWVLKPSAAGWPIPCWYYTEADYQAGPLGHLWTPPGEGAGGQRITKEFSPVCVQRLSAGRHLIVNYRSVMENLTHANVPTATDAYACQGDQLRTPPSLAPDVFEVETRYATPNDPTTQLHTIDVDKCIPNPWLDDWNDPINQPSFAQRCQESLPPLRP